MPDEDLVSTEEAGQILGKSARTVRRMAERGQIPTVRNTPRLYLFSRQVVEVVAQQGGPR